MTSVTLMAFTQVTPMFDELAGTLGWEGTSSRPAELLAEFAGRACYQSWHKPNPATADTDAYLANVKRQNHLSVVEHASVSFYLQDVSRSLTHELVRHRHFSFSQLSQRYVDMGGHDEAAPHAVMPPLCRGDAVAEMIVNDAFFAAVEAYGVLERHLRVANPDLGVKQIREAARAVLPNCTPTSIVVSGNFRSWLEFIDKRDSPHADREISAVAAQIRRELERVAPAVFDGTTSTVAEQRGPILPEYLPGSEP